MKTYTIYAPIPTATAEERSYNDQAMEYEFIKEGASLWAAIFGPFWLLIKGMWGEVAIYVATVIAFGLVFQLIGLNAQAISIFLFISNLIFAFFARDIERLYFERRGYEMISVVNGKSEEECEARYFRAKENNKTINIIQSEASIT